MVDRKIGDWKHPISTAGAFPEMEHYGALWSIGSTSRPEQRIKWSKREHFGARRPLLLEAYSDQSAAADRCPPTAYSHWPKAFLELEHFGALGAYNQKRSLPLRAVKFHSKEAERCSK